MAGIQRFVTYLYLYDGDEKMRNTGFAKVEIRGEQCRLEIHIKSAGLVSTASPIYLFAREDEIMHGIEVGKVNLQGGNGDFKALLKSTEIGHSPYGIADMKGIVILLNDQYMFASQWDDGSILRGRIRIWEPKLNLPETEEPKKEQRTESQSPPNSGMLNRAAQLQNSGTSNMTPQPPNSGVPNRTSQPQNNGMPNRAAQPQNNGMPNRAAQPQDNGMPNGAPQPQNNGMPSRAAQPQDNGMPNGAPQPQNNGMPNRAAQPQDNGMPDRMPQQQNNGMPNRMPQPQNNGMPNGMPQPQNNGMPNRMPQPQNSGMPNGMPQQQNNGMPNGMPQPQNNGMPNGMPRPQNNGMPNRMPQPQNSGMPNGMPQPQNNGMPNRMPQPQNNGMPNGMPQPQNNGASNGMPNRMPQPQDNGMPNGMPNRMPQPQDNGMPNGMPYRMPQPQNNGMPNGMPYRMPQPQNNGMPGGSPQTETNGENGTQTRMQSREPVTIKATEMPMRKFMNENAPLQESLQDSYLRLQKRIEDVDVFQTENMRICGIHIELRDIRELSKRYWYLGNNSFLLHGFFNYRYLFLGKKIAEDKETIFLGVPGVFSSQERVMAALFGFPEFLPENRVQFEQAQKQGNERQESFGYWCHSMPE